MKSTYFPHRFHRICFFSTLWIMSPQQSFPELKVKTDKADEPFSFNHMSEKKCMEFLLNCMKMIQFKYVEKIDQDSLMQGALKGMLYDADIHSTFLNGKEYARLTNWDNGSVDADDVGGIGVELGKDRFGRIIIITCLDDTPAAKAGLLPGDVIGAIDDVAFRYSNQMFNCAEKLWGKPGTDVKVSIERKGHAKWLHFVMKRKIIAAVSVKHRINDGMAIIRIPHFNNKTADLLKKAILDVQKVLKNTVKGYILDLRNNPGGLIDSCMRCCSFFVDQGVLWRTKGRPGTPEHVIYAEPGQILVKNKPVIILINEGSASAAEIMAGALQDRKVAVVLGVRSFGKGVGQSIIPLEHKAGAIKLTTMRGYTPISHQPVQGHGIRPDIKVEQVESIQPLRHDSEMVRAQHIAGMPPPESAFKAPHPNLGKNPSDHQSKDKSQDKSQDKGGLLVASQSPASLSKTEGLKPIQKMDSSTQSKVLNTVPYDHQMMRAIELIKALNLVQEGRVFKIKNKTAASSPEKKAGVKKK